MSLDFGIYGSGHKKDVLEIIRSLDSHPTAGRVIYHEKLAKELEKKGSSLDEMLDANLDFMMTVGGDGTILRLLQKVDHNILGINTGRVGFLTAVELSELNDALERMDGGDYFVDERIKLKTILNGEDIGESTNEVVVHTDKVAKIRSFEVFHGDRLVDRFRADGVIVATPTGSTCYSMSAGGPIVDPGVNAFIIVPLSPYKLATKPFVVPIDDDIRMNLIEDGKTCLMVLDGQKECTVDDNDELIFRIGDRTAKFVRFEHDFFSQIHKKLVWK